MATSPPTLLHQVFAAAREDCMLPPIANGQPGPRGPMFSPTTGRPPKPPKEVRIAAEAKAADEGDEKRPVDRRRGPSYLENQFEQDLLEETRKWGGNAFVPFTAPAGPARLPLEHDVLHHEGSEMRVEANPAALGALSSTLTAAPMLGAAVAATTALLKRG